MWWEVIGAEIRLELGCATEPVDPSLLHLNTQVRKLHSSYPKGVPVLLCPLDLCPVLWATPSHLCPVLAMLLFQHHSYLHHLKITATDATLWCTAPLQNACEITNNLFKESLNWPRAFRKSLKPWIHKEKAFVPASEHVPW